MTEIIRTSLVLKGQEEYGFIDSTDEDEICHFFLFKTFMKFTVTIYMLQDLPSFFVLTTNLAQNPIWKMFFPL